MEQLRVSPDIIAKHAQLLAEETKLGHDELVLTRISSELADHQRDFETLTRTLSGPKLAPSDVAKNGKVSRMIVRLKTSGSARKAERQRLREAQTQLQALNNSIRVAEEQLVALNQRRESHGELQQSINDLHTSIFEESGALHEEEVAARLEYENATKASLDAKEALKMNEEAYRYLEQARIGLAHAQHKTHIATAVPSKKPRDIHTKRMHLATAQDGCFRAYSCFNEAQRLVPAIKGLSMPEIRNRTIFKDLLMEDITNHAVVRTGIFNANIAIHWALERANDEHTAQAQRVTTARATAERTTTEMFAAYDRLSAVRRRIVIDMSGRMSPASDASSDASVPAHLPAYPAAELPSY